MEQHKLPKRLLILGNGFDLDLGRNTRYSDFAKSDLWPKNMESELYEHLNQKSKIERWFDLEGELANYVAEWSQPYMSGYQTAIPEIAQKDEQDFNIIVEAMISYLISVEKDKKPNLLYSPLVLFIVCLTFPALQNVFKLTLCAAMSKNNLVHTLRSWKICYQQAI